MSEQHASGRLQIDESPALQRRFLAVERLGWLAMALVLVASLLGAFGDGWLSRATAASGRDLRIDYERYGRRERPITLRIRALPSPDGEVRLWVSQSYLDAAPAETVSPMPDAVLAGSGRTTYVFRSGGGTAAISLKVRPEALGTLSAEAGLEGGARVSFSHFLFP